MPGRKDKQHQGGTKQRGPENPAPSLRMLFLCVRHHCTVKLAAVDLLDSTVTTLDDVTANLYEPVGHENVIQTSLPALKFPGPE
jgi:hypothetical protein